MKYNLIRNKITSKFPALRLIPKFGVFEQSWNELEKEKIIQITHLSYQRYDFVMFLNEFYQKIEIDIYNIETEQKKIPFQGRKITPERFIDELLQLDKGDFNDTDDQVTRLAGLVLSESVKIQSPHEKINEFDFTMDLNNYNFRPEQIEAISKLNFKIDFQIIHVKVMIDEKLSFKKYCELKKKVPPNEQGTVVTFKKISDEIKNDMVNDNTIQIIDEEGIKTWVSITSKIPARTNSISKITFDPLSKLENKIVKVTSVFYETGIALVNVFPEMNEVTVLVRTLEETYLHMEDTADFDEFTNNYYAFLQFLFTTSTYEDVISGIFKDKIKDVSNSKDFFKFEFNYNVVELDISRFRKQDIFNCNCIKYAENNLKFCNHLISALDYIFRNYPKRDKIINVLDMWIKENISIILDRLEITEDNFMHTQVADFVSGKLKVIKDL